jgi:ribosome production factor 2
MYNGRPETPAGMPCHGMPSERHSMPCHAPSVPCTALSVLLGTARQRPRLPPTAACVRARSPPAAGTRVPRVDLAEMGPSMDLELRRSRQAAAELEKEATKQPKLTKKKVRLGAGPTWMGGG